MHDQLTELGVLTNNESPAVQRVGARLIDKYFSSYPASDLDMETTALVLYYMTDIQVRDYAMGLLDTYSKLSIELGLKHLVDQAPTDSIYISGPASILAQLYYEQGNTADAFLTLTNAQPDYSLARLLDRVFRASAPKEMFAAMRKELHPQVVKNIFGEEE
jgi:hypothetical protein